MKGIREVSAASWGRLRGRGGGTGKRGGASKNSRRMPPTSSLPDSALLGMEGDLRGVCPFAVAEAEVEEEEEGERRSLSDAIKASCAPSFALSNAEEEEDGKDSRAEGRITTYTINVAALSASAVDAVELGRGREGRGVSRTGTVHSSSAYKKH